MATLRHIHWVIWLEIKLPRKAIPAALRLPSVYNANVFSLPPPPPATAATAQHRRHQRKRDPSVHRQHIPLKLIFLVYIFISLSLFLFSLSFYFYTSFLPSFFSLLISHSLLYLSYSFSSHYLSITFFLYFLFFCELTIECVSLKGNEKLKWENERVSKYTGKD